MSIHTIERRRQPLWAVALAGACLAGLFTFAADPAQAAYKAQVQGGTLQIIGDAASDKLGLQVSPADPNVLQVDVGEDGTTDFSFDRTTFTAIDVEAGGGDDEVRIGSGTGLGNVTIDGGAGNDTLIGGPEADVLIGGSG